MASTADAWSGERSTSVTKDLEASITGPANPAQHPTRKAQQIASIPQDPIPLQGPTDNPVLKSVIPTFADSPRYPPKRSQGRLFGLEEAPTFYPTEEEFADPMKYIEWVGSAEGGHGKSYGIVKIVPPDGWHPDCVLDQEKFRFRTRVQQLNSLSADARATQNYEEQLQKFHSQQGSNRVSIPIIDRRPVDLYQLKLAVQRAGGCEHVNRQRRWVEITKTMGYAEKDATHLAAQVKSAYLKIIDPFERFMSRAREQAKTCTSPGTAAATSASSAAVVAAAVAALAKTPGSRASSTVPPAVPKVAKPASETTTTTTAPPAQQQQAQEDAAAAATRRSGRRRVTETSSGRPSRHPRHDDSSSESSDEVTTITGAEEQMCELCLQGDDGLAMLLCDECNRGYHMYCLDPPLATVPKSQWYCPPCLVGTGNDYGFDDGETHSLSSFWKRADAFRRAWFARYPQAIRIIRDKTHNSHEGPLHPIDEAPRGVVRPIAGTDLRVAEDDVEREFWRLIHDQHETVEVEYGADIHSTTHGSALPTLETHPLDKYARDGWNLNNLPILPSSLLRYIKSDISGMTVPWIYVGMMFSTFCWHNEDHHTYSINYQHYGDTKTWYGVPGGDAELFEEAMRRAAPDLFETSPDLLYQLVTMMSPAKLKDEGVRVYACDQRANEFVITFPKAYHSGFNQGFNLNEAVNFALPDWIDFDRECVGSYQRFKKPPVFSHDELIITASQHSTGLETAQWLSAPMKEMVDRELSQRKTLRDIVPALQLTHVEHDLPEAEYQCTYCNCFCYLSQVTSPAAEGVACLEHAFQVCGGDDLSKWVLRQRFTDDQLRSILSRVSEKADLPGSWKQRLHKLLVSQDVLPLRNLRTLLAEGEKIDYHMAEVEELRTFVDCANKWVLAAQKVTPKRYGGRGTSTSVVGKRRKSAMVASESPMPRLEDESSQDTSDTERNPDALRSLLQEAEYMRFDAPEIGTLREAITAAEEALKGCDDVIRRIRAGGTVSVEDCNEVLSRGTGLATELPEHQEIKTYLAGQKWLGEMDDIAENHISLEEVEELLTEFKQTGLPADHEHHLDLQQRLIKGKQWNQDAKKVLDGGNLIDVRQLQKLTSTPNEVPVVIATNKKLEKLLNNSTTWQQAMTAVMDGTKQGFGSEEQLAEARKLVRSVQTSKLDLPLAIQLQRDIDIYDDWRAELINSVVGSIEDEDDLAGLTPSQVQDVVKELCNKIECCADANDDSPLPDMRSIVQPRQCFCRVPHSSITTSEEGSVLKCKTCQCSYHAKCAAVAKDDPRLASATAAGVEGSDAPPPQDGQAPWHCPICDIDRISAVIKDRKAVSFDALVNLIDHSKYQFPSLRFKPSEYEQIRKAVEQVTRLSNLAQSFLGSNLDIRANPSVPEAHHHLLLRSIGIPVDISADPGMPVISRCVLALARLHGKRVIADIDGLRESDQAVEPAQQTSIYPVYDTSMDMDDSVAPEIDMSTSGNNATSPDDSYASTSQAPSGTANITIPLQKRKRHVATNDGSNSNKDQADKEKRRRGKRAKLVFTEEVGIWVPVNGERIYCLCHQKESNSMISCDRCMLWFHAKCVHIANPQALKEKWHCPMCCVKTEKRYPYAEVKVKEMGVTDPDMWLDVRGSLRSTGRPISKLQQWCVPADRRIVLHLDSFYPAIGAPTNGAEQNGPDAKRARMGSAPGGSAGPPDGTSGGRSAPIVVYDDNPPPVVPPPRTSMDAGLPAGPIPYPPPPSGPAAGPNNSTAKAVSPPSGPATSPPPPGSYGVPIQSSPPSRRSGGWQTTPKTDYEIFEQQQEAARRAREERHRVGMANLHARGVTDAMIDRYLVGWDGKRLVYPGWDPLRPHLELDLGPAIQLAPDDPDGTRLIQNAIQMRRHYEWEQRQDRIGAQAAALAQAIPPAGQPLGSPSGAGHRSSAAPPVAPGSHRNSAGPQPQPPRHPGPPPPLPTPLRPVNAHSPRMEQQSRHGSIHSPQISHHPPAGLMNSPSRVRGPPYGGGSIASPAPGHTSAAASTTDRSQSAAPAGVEASSSFTPAVAVPSAASTPAPEAPKSADPREAFRTMARKMVPYASEPELEAMVDRLMS